MHPNPVFQNEAVRCTVAASRDSKMEILDYSGNDWGVR